MKNARQTAPSPASLAPASGRFRNIEPPYEFRGFWPVFKWLVWDSLWGRRTRHPRTAPVPTATPDLALIRSDAASLTWVGHATWLLRLAGISIVTDPVWLPTIGGGLKRNVAPGIALSDAAPEVVLVSHNHFDHMDPPSLRAIGPSARYFVPRGLGPTLRKMGLEQVVELDWWQTTSHGPLQITFVPSQHWSQRGIFDRNRTLWGGFVVESTHTVYFAGDTAYFSGFKRIAERFPKIDAALLPIGAYDPRWYLRDQHMDPDDAARAFIDLGAKRLCSMHWGTFKMTDEPLEEPPALLEEVCRAKGIDRASVWTAAVGETRPL